MCTTNQNGQQGFTLIEVIIFITIISVGLAGILSVMNVTASKSADPLSSKQAIAIAESLLEEIQTKDFDATVTDRGGTACYSGTISQANRQSFDCIANYGSFSTTGIYPIDSTTVIPGLSNYNVSVSLSQPALGIVSDAWYVAAGNVYLITVTVTAPDSRTYSLTGYRFNYG